MSLTSSVVEEYVFEAKTEEEREALDAALSQFRDNIELFAWTNDDSGSLLEPARVTRWEQDPRIRGPPSPPKGEYSESTLLQVEIRPGTGSYFSLEAKSNHVKFKKQTQGDLEIEIAETIYLLPTSTYFPNTTGLEVSPACEVPASYAGSRLKTMGEEIRDLRLGRELSMRDLAEQARTSCSHVSQIEHSQRYASDEVLERISAALSVSVEHLKQYDPRVPIALLRDRAEKEPAYRHALQRVTEAGLGAGELLELANRVEARKRE